MYAHSVNLSKYYLNIVIEGETTTTTTPTTTSTTEIYGGNIICNIVICNKHYKNYFSTLIL